MRRVLTALVLAVATATGFAGVAPPASPPVVELFTTSATVSPDDLRAALPALQTAVSRDLASAWGVDAQLVVGDAARPQRADMTLTVGDHASGCDACRGYHALTAHGQPYARVFVDPKESTFLMLTHELFEMLVNPRMTRVVHGDGRSWVVEVCDPLMSGYYAYRIDGIDVSDFVTPAWYSRRAAGPYDVQGVFIRPGEVGRHGYASYVSRDGRLAQVFG